MLSLYGQQTYSGAGTKPDVSASKPPQSDRILTPGWVGWVYWVWMHEVRCFCDKYY